MDATIMEAYRGALATAPEMQEWHAMAVDLWRREIGPTWDDPTAAMAAYERHNDEVRSRAPADRFVDWNAAQGWEPLCSVLGLAVPAEPFPHVNSTAEWEQRRRDRAAEEARSDAPSGVAATAGAESGPDDAAT
jgi:hypothetical protein